MELRSRNKIQTGASMSSMTDLVFLLLIFFIILSTLVSPYALPVDLPASRNKSFQKPKISVTINDRNEFYINSKKVSEADFEKEFAAIIGAEKDNKSIVLHVDKIVPTGEMVKVLDVAKRNDCKIVLATKPN